jgi:hypothetical protein
MKELYDDPLADTNLIDLWDGESGAWLAAIPDDLVEELGRANGNVDELAYAVAEDARCVWADTIELLISLRRYGAWDRETLVNMTTADMRARIAWIGCAQYTESGTDEI